MSPTAWKHAEKQTQKQKKDTINYYFQRFRNSCTEPDSKDCFETNVPL